MISRGLFSKAFHWLTGWREVVCSKSVSRVMPPWTAGSSTLNAPTGTETNGDHCQSRVLAPFLFAFSDRRA
eukprot:1728322-Pyramimonas_sp.AAC.1